MSGNEKIQSSDAVLEALFATIKSRKGGDAAQSYTAQLLVQAPEKPARKLAEEAVEAVIAALQNDKAALTSEAADVVYHLLVLLAGADIELEDVLAELRRREGVSGLDEKAARSKS